MAGSTSLPLGPMAPGPSDVMARIEKNTRDTVLWLKVLTGLVVVLILALVLL